MDLKGLGWAGNIYQKFETMCLEVEEVMYEDTVKYVENQVQKVGVSVKKFYFEVMQDLLPQSCVDPVKVAAGDLSVNPYAHMDMGTDLKPKSLENLLEFKKKTDDEVISGIGMEKRSPTGLNNVSHLSSLSTNVLDQESNSEMYSAKTKKVGVYRRPIGIRRISDKNRPIKVSRAMIPESGDLSRMSSSCDSQGNCLIACNEENNIPSLHDDKMSESGEPVNTNAPIVDGPVESSTTPNIISSVDSVRQKEEESQCTSSNHGLHTESSDGDAVTQSGSNTISPTDHHMSSGEEFIVFDEDDFGLEIIKNEEVEPVLDIFEQVENLQLEDSCVLVEEDQLHFGPQGSGKHKSYKKKIREAFSSKLRSARKQEQDVQHGKKGAEVAVPPLTVESDKIKLAADDSSGCDWELI